ncbi:MAG TPA: spiro-SPASM protein [Spirochaetota bacterium]|nr:spiro-SPASM protein [Spirochaetota bacterium]HRZ25245.1 spiro-SPASM protein [Spirochaetota bacterium]HSA14057.1 spiro-SPASM protein [Spirochaetota bacterium]
MKTDLLIYVNKGLSDADLTFNGSFIPLELAEKYSSIEKMGDAYFSIPSGSDGALSGDSRTIVRAGDDDADFWRALFEKTGSDHIIKVMADSPFLDFAVIRDMAAVHTGNLAEFTYSENLPEGMACEIYSRELVGAIPEFKEKTLPLTKVIRSNMNQFDIELYYRDPDIRDKRLSFRSSNPRERKIMQNMVAAGGGVPSYERIKEIIEKDPGVLYAGPSYVEIELTGECELDCIFCYRKMVHSRRADMDAGLFRKILEGMKGFALPYTVCFGGSGEPLMNRDFYSILDAAMADPLIERIIVETNGVLAGQNYRNYISGHASGKIKTVVNINGHDRDSYAKLHGADRFETVRENIAGLKQALAGAPADALHVQIMKINETEPFLDAYYDYWEKQNIPIILQKQNAYLGLIKDRRYSDLSPLDRVPCWHLQRDLYILSDGAVTFCKVDVNAAAARGNVAESGIADIWEKGRAAFLGDYAGAYASCPDCASCDEWYTFNF